MHLSTHDYVQRLYYVAKHYVKNHCCKTFECCFIFVFLLFFSGYGPTVIYILPLINRKKNWFCMILVASLFHIFVERSHES
jgi:hypothetical protein